MVYKNVFNCNENIEIFVNAFQCQLSLHFVILFVFASEKSLFKKVSGKVSLDIFDLVCHAGTCFHVLIMNVIEEEKKFF